MISAKSAPSYESYSKDQISWMNNTAKASLQKGSLLPLSYAEYLPSKSLKQCWISSSSNSTKSNRYIPYTTVLPVTTGEAWRNWGSYG
jgi:hypothetical protein